MAGIAALPPTASASSADSHASRHPQPELQEGLDRIVETGAVGAVAEVRSGHATWRGTSGVSRLGGSAPVPPRSRFRAGSITKAFVATVVLQLVAEGRLRLSDPVSRWLPGAVTNGQQITVRDLLDQTSGIADYRETLILPPDPAFLSARHRTWRAGELIARGTALPPTSEHPGTTFAYSNTNYLLLGELITSVTGRTYADEIDRRIIRPLGLHGTSLPGTSERIPGPHPHGYVPIQDALADDTDFNRR